jgi:hypothetical protein
MTYIPPNPNYLMGGKASKHLFCVSKAFLKLSTALSNPLPPGVVRLLSFLAPERPFLLTVSGSQAVLGSYLGRAANVWPGTYQCITIGIMIMS